MRPCLYPSVETVESILQRAPPELTTAGRTETKPWWEEDRPEPSPIASAPKPKPADQDSVCRPSSTAAFVSEKSSEQTNPTVSDAVTMRLVHKTYEDDKGYLVTEIPPSPHHRYNTNSVGIIHTLSRGGGRGGVTDEGLVSDYGIGHG